MPIRVLIADDHKLFRQGLMSLMRTRDDLVEVVGEAETGQEAIRLVEQQRPDIVLMDIFMPQGDGLFATKEIRSRFPNTAVVMLTSSENEEHLYEAMRLGAAGYLLKSLDADELFDLLTRVIQGEVAMTRTMASRLLKGLATGHSDTNSEREKLTDREAEVLRLVARGNSNPQIAVELCITVNTVKSHLKNILSKLKLDNRTQVAAYAAKSGLLPGNSGKYHPTG
jgi:two-component system, NarL family, nitrate/nitrite response regulator NarL